MFGNVADRVPHGGPIVAFMGGIDGVVMYLIAIAVGSLVTALMVNYLKSLRNKKEVK